MAIIGPISVKDENATAKPSGMLCKVIATAIKIPKRIKRPREASVSPGTGLPRSFIAEDMDEDIDFDKDDDVFDSLLFTFPPPDPPDPPPFCFCLVPPGPSFSNKST